ncbi:MAG: protein translocase subunit SecF [bacterium (Candidatus Stahlbacteria) CG08_land_8_20_14_0_20_40_26]|nr:MAG: protein translocase subunit SecF [bacterium (Candidatus Stahlbacteria) CG23_combo_of_CG06-09_8_20_14_all_40_9]PIS26290.1 MAG: protein translocase subunit SecF [bacterium (Candidatus Stahlbacteria) CG08_land_8_20_14_0_20_40_26]
MVSLFGKTNINFIDFRRKGFIISLALLVVGIISVATQSGLNYGLDFTGGSFVEVHFNEDVDIGSIRSVISDVGLGDAVIQRVKEADYNYMIRTRLTEYEGKSMGTVLNKVLNEKFSDNGVRIEREEMVGPVISRALQAKAIWVVLLGMVIILIYVSVRFTYRFGIASVIALFHDVLITIGILSLARAEFSSATIAALLTIIGYSINDSIVLSDRVKDNLKKERGKRSFSEIINASVNQNLARTVNTSLTTLFVLLALYLLGGRMIRDFALALLIGVIIGTYSSIVIVAGLVVEWERRLPVYSHKAGGR